MLPLCYASVALFVYELKPYWSVPVSVEWRFATAWRWTSWNWKAAHITMKIIQSRNNFHSWFWTSGDSSYCCHGRDKWDSCFPWRSKTVLNHGTMVSIRTWFQTKLLQVRFPQEKIVDAVDVHQRRWFEESWQWLEKIDRTPLVLASGKLVLQKVFIKLAIPIEGKNTWSTYTFFQIDPKLFGETGFQWNSIPSGKWNIDLSLCLLAM